MTHQTPEPIKGDASTRKDEGHTGTTALNASSASVPATSPTNTELSRTVGQQIADEYYNSNQLSKERLARLIDAARADVVEDITKILSSLLIQIPSDEDCIYNGAINEALTLITRKYLAANKE